MVSAWYIPTFFVPLLLVTHAMSFAQLLRRAAAQSDSRFEEPALVTAAQK